MSSDDWILAWTLLSLRPNDDPRDGSVWLIQVYGGRGYYACRGVYSIREGSDPNVLLVRLGFW